ncbi:MAG: OmpA family protein [Candidatus Kapabacteria bacterium]|nr:OmpA family protein [Ignavibacteriota bacterium]MCW5886017.1 OmpA family protein [Candidatus Kapabacteria bacterium]
MQRIYFFIISLLFLLPYENTYSEGNAPHQAGAIFGPNLIFNNSRIPLIPGTDDCGVFENGNAIAFWGGLFYTYTYIPDYIYLDARLFYEKRPVDLTANSSGYQVLSPVSNLYEPLIRKHHYSGSLEYIAFDFGVKVQPIMEIPASLRIGIEAGNPIVSANYENTEQIVSPQGVLFPDETLKNTVASGNINDAGTAFAASLSASYSYKLNSGLILEPSLTYRKSLNSIVSSSDWNQDIVRLSISVGMNFGGDKAPGRLPEKPKETIIEAPDEESKPIVRSISTGEVILQETIVTQTYPILPYIFFNSLSADIKNVYTLNSPSNFDEAKLPKDNLKIYYNILNIIGSRMIKYPDAKLTISGTQDGSENIEYRDNSIARNRADNIAEYLNKNWKIEKSRLKVNTLRKATLPTSEVYPEGFEENRRVELASDDIRIFEPVVHTKFSEFKPSTNNIIISPTLDSDLVEWDIQFIFNGKDVKRYQGKGNIPSSFSINDIINTNDITSDNLLRFNLNVKDIKGTSEKLSRSIPVNINRNKFELGRLNLIVFDFDKSEINDMNKQMIENFALKAVKNNSEIAITGSTDRLGEIDYNLKLSQSRAENVNRLLKTLANNPNIKEIKGLGSSALKFDNNTPEGRFYSRTVLIEVQTPLE